MPLTFNKKLHEYQWGGQVVPSVTQALSEWIRIGIVGGFYVNTFSGQAIPARLFEHAADFGTAVHKAAGFILRGELDWGAMAPELIGPCLQFEAWRRDFAPDISGVEGRLYSQGYGYAGTYDLLISEGSRKWLIIDIKTGGHDLAGPQLAAYEQLLREDGVKGIIRRAVLYLPKDGGPYKLIEQTDARDWPFFLASLNRHNYLAGRR